jgi:hypothetical protein
VIALLGCQNAAEDSASQARGEPAAEEQVASEDYPRLQTVPPRPQLSYTVQQQREIVDALIADRENARHTGQVVRYRSGLSTLPPPPAPPVSEITEAPEQAPPAGGAASSGPDAADAEESLLRAETFDVFLRALRRQLQSDAPEPTEPAPPPDAPAAPIEHDDAAHIVAIPDVALAAGSVNESANETVPQPPHLPTESAVAARQATPADQLIVPAPLPPTQTAVAARQAADPTDPDTGTPIPAPRPDHAAHSDPTPATMPEPPPGKPAWPVDGRSAAIATPEAVGSTAAFTVHSAHVGARTLAIAGKALL